MKKILIIVGALSVGGAENMIYELTKNINRDLFDVSILCYLGKRMSSIEEKIEKSTNIIYMNETGKAGVKSLSSVFRVINSINPDIIHAHLGGMVYAIPWAFIHPRKALMITAHTRADKAFKKKVEWLLRMMLKYQKDRTMIVAVSEENNIAIKKYFSVNDEVCRCINNGIAIDKFYREEHSCFTFINVAQHDQNKNQIAIIRAVEKILKTGRKVSLLLVGDGPCHNNLKSEVRRLGLSNSVIFTGQVSDPEKYYAQADVYAQTSFQEALPLSVLEAMAAGLPIIATNVGGLRDVVDKNGILIPAGDDEALVSAMIKIMDASASEYEIMAENSKSMVKNYSSVRMAEQYEQAYDKLLDRRK